MMKGRRKVVFLILLVVLLCVTLIEDKPLPDAIKKKGEAADKHSLLKNITHQLVKAGNSSGEVNDKRQRIAANTKQTTHEINGSIAQVKAGKLVFKSDIQSAIPSELDIKRETVTEPNKTTSDSAIGVDVLEQNGHNNTYLITNATAHDSPKINMGVNSQPNNTDILKDHNATNRKPLASVLHINGDKIYVSAHNFNKRNESKENITYTSSIDSRLKNASKENISQSGLIVMSENKLKYVQSLKGNITNHNDTVTFDAVIEEHATKSTTKVTKQTTVKEMTTVAMKSSTTTPRYENNSLAKQCKKLKRKGIPLPPLCKKDLTGWS